MAFQSATVCNTFGVRVKIMYTFVGGHAGWCTFSNGFLDFLAWLALDVYSTFETELE